MEPWMSWVLALGVGATGYYYYSRPRADKPARTQPKDTRPKDSVQKRQDNRDEEVHTEIQKPKKRKQAQREQPAAITSTAVEKSTPAAQDLEQEEDDRQWAQQLQAAKQGVSMTASKAAQAIGAPKPAKQSDDRSLDGANGIKGPASRDVSDMLEPATGGPSSIRITGEEKKKKQTPKKEEAPKETKKQRQNRKKNEDRKANREDEERERKKLEENQRRSAREARGEPAKNGVAIAPAPANNAWTTSKVNGSSNTSNSAQPSMLLDTFEHDGGSTTSSNDHTTPASFSSQNMPSEEEQMEAIREMNGWNEVRGKKGKKKVSAPASPPVEPGVKEVTNANFSHAAELAGGATYRAPAVPNKSVKSTNEFTHLDPSSRIGPAASARSPVSASAPKMKAHPEDSDWAVE